MFRSIRSYVALLFAVIFFHQLFSSGYVAATYSQIQRQFGFSVTQTLALSSTYNICRLFLSLPMNYIVGKGNIPWHLSRHLILIGFGNALYALPGFLAASATDASSSFPTCTASSSPFSNTTSLACTPTSSSSSSSTFYFLIFFAAQIITALGSSAMYQSGIAHINANANPRYASAYIAIVYCIGPLGTAVGFVLMGSFLANNTWHHAILFNAIIILLIVPLFMQLEATPSKLSSGIVAPSPSPSPTPSTPSRHRSSLIAVEDAEKIANLNDETFISTAKSIITDRVWLAACLGSTFEWFATSAFTNAGPQFMEAVFGQHRSSASVLAGVVLVPAATLGTIVGGLWESRFHKSLASTSFFNGKCAFLSCVIMVSMIFINCETINIIGLGGSDGYDYEGGGGICNCGQEYNPICIDDVSYFSPCVAGCTDWESLADIKAMSEVEQMLLKKNCSKIVAPTTNTTTIVETLIGDGLCKSDGCPKLGTFLMIFFAGLFFTFLNVVPTSVVLLRCIPTHHSAISLALSDTISKIFGNIPGPLYIGAIFDANCKVKSISYDDNCDMKESCALFDNERLFEAMAIDLSAIFKLASFLCAFACYYCLKGTSEGDLPYDENVVDKGGDEKAFRKLSVDTVESGSTVGRKRRPSSTNR